MCSAPNSRQSGERKQAYADGPVEYSHTLTEQIGGQLAAGFTLTHLTEAPYHAGPTAQYLPGYFATRAVKPLAGPGQVSFAPSGHQRKLGLSQIFSRRYSFTCAM